MARNIIDLPTLGDDGKLYRDTAVDMVESLIPNPWESCHAPDLLELENGDLLCCWFAGSREGNADISIAVARLPADAEQWEQPVIVSDDPTRSEQNPSLFQNPNGDIWLMYTAQAAKKPDDNSDDSLQGTAEIRRKISRDGGRTWGPTEAVFTRPGSFCRQKIQVLSNGRWIFNNFICALDGTRLGSDVTVIQISDDQGKTWNPANWSACCAAVQPTISTARNPMTTAKHGACRYPPRCATTTPVSRPSSCRAAHLPSFIMMSLSMRMVAVPSGPTSDALWQWQSRRMVAKHGRGAAL